MWRAAILSLLLFGCGGAVTGPLDDSGCPLNASDWTGTATLTSGCAGAPQTIQVSGAYTTDGSGNPNGPYLMSAAEGGGVCTAYLVADVPCGKASYVLKMAAQ